MREWGATHTSLQAPHFVIGSVLATDNMQLDLRSGKGKKGQKIENKKVIRGRLSGGWELEKKEGNGERLCGLLKKEKRK